MARRSILTYSQDELNRYYAVMWVLKQNGVLDQFTQQHMLGMRHLDLYPGETGTSRNAGHRGPLFFPWHTWLLKQLELAGQQVDAAFELPYFDTTGMSAGGADWRKSPLWNIIGGNGISTQSWSVVSGPFASGGPWAGWWSYIYSNGTFIKRNRLKRQFNTRRNMPGPANLSLAPYDAAPYNEHVSTSASWRSAAEPRHNALHTNVGGDMKPGTSPNDPLFYLHHCWYDLQWRSWQALHGYDAGLYLPQSGGPPENNVNDLLFFSTSTTIKVWAVPAVRVADVIDPRAIGVAYS
jgi:tyrosinase